MKRFLNIFFASLLAFAVAACSTVPGGDSITTAVAAATDVLTGPDTDYKNYLSHCRAEVKAQADAFTADSKALQAGLTSGNEKTQYGATLIMAFKAGQGGPKIGCTVARKKGAVELMLGESNILNLGVELYRENRAGARFKRQLEADKELTILRLEHESSMTGQNNDLLTTLTGDKLQLQQSSQDDAYRRAQLAPATPPASP